MKLIDISHCIDNMTPAYPGDHKTQIKQCNTIADDGYCLHLYTTSLHTGTHIDMPMHLTDDNKTAAQFDINMFAGKGVLLDVRGEQAISMKPCYEKMDFDNSIVLLFTGFDQHYYTEKYFTHHPVVSDELCDFLICKNIKMLGIDMPSPDHTPFKVHKKLLSAGIFVLENITNLHELCCVEKFEVLAFPLKIMAEASVVRAVCRI